MAILNKDQIWGADDIQERDVEVPQWKGPDGKPGQVRIRSLTLEQVSEIRAHAVKTVKGKEEVDARLQMAGLLCEGIIQPELDFNEAQRLMKKSAAAVGVIVQAINEISGLLAEDVSEAEKSTDVRPESSLSVVPSSRAEDDPQAATPRDVYSRVEPVDGPLQRRGARA